MAEEQLECEGCGSTGDDVCSTTTWWTAWGRKAFDLNWSQIKGEKALCEECESEDWGVCEDCGVLVERDHHGVGYLPDDLLGVYLCPTCAIQRGHKATVEVFTFEKPSTFAYAPTE